MNTNQICIHCGENCGKHPVIWDNKPFCCNGCKTVYQLLDQNKLYTYYKLEDTPGIKLDKPELGNKYAYLDHEEIIESLLDFREGDFSKATLYVPGIHCASCIWLLENLNRLHPGIISSSVNFVKKEVYISFKEAQISLRQIVEMLVSIHYIPQITLDRTEQKGPIRGNKALLYKVGIAGFAFGNIMMLSLPEYLPGGEYLEANFRQFFGYLNFILVLPVLLYSSTDYFLSAIKSLKHKIISIDLPISIGIVTLFAQSSFEIFSKIGQGYMDSLAGLVFFLLVGKWYQNKTYAALSFERDYKSYFPVAVTRITEGKEESIPLGKLQVGNTILVRHEELIPADGEILNGKGNIDYSFVTGESKPVSKQTGDEVFAGGKQIGSAIELKINKEVAQSRLTLLWNQDKTHDTENKANLLGITDTISRNFTIIILSIAALAGIYWLYTDSSVALRAFTSVLIVACPCALALSVPFTFGGTMRIMGRLGFYLKQTDVVEKLTKVNTVVYDKTGTITEPNTADVKWHGTALSSEEYRILKSLTRQSAHPMSIAVTNSLPAMEPFTVHNFMEVQSGGVVADINEQKIKAGSELFVTGTSSQTKKTSGNVFVSFNNIVKGYFSVENKYRKGVSKVLEQLKGRGFSQHLISGDNDAERTKLSEHFGFTENLHFNQSPNDKLNYIKQLKSEKQNVLMIGDGLNDAGALGESDTGISIADDIYRFSPACDAILEADKFEKLPKLLHFAKRSVTIVKISFVISFLYNIIGVSFAVRGMLSPVIAAILMPVSSVTVVVFVSFAVNLLGRSLFNLPNSQKRTKEL